MSAAATIDTANLNDSPVSEKNPAAAAVVTAKSGGSPWAKAPAQPIIYSLEDVMSEQLATELQEKEYDSAPVRTEQQQQPPPPAPLIEGSVEAEASVDSDFLLAQLLQLEYDKEHDTMLKLHEDHKNKHSSVHISYDKFKSVHPTVENQEKLMDNLVLEDDLSSSSESDDETLEKLTFKRGVRGKGENMISKHDLVLSAKLNGSKIMNFPPEFETGDGHNFEFRLSNKVFNQLKLHSMAEERRQNRLHDKQDKSTAEMSLDPKTRLILFKLVNADILDSIGGVISTGKEATILYAGGGKTQEVLVPKECVAKVFKTTLNEFKTREKYIGDDYRFKDRYKHLNPQKIVKLWAEKEMHNLMKMRRFELPCPDVICLKKHVLIMSFVGTDCQPAPKLKDADLDEAETQSAYDQCVQILEDLYHKCNLVHADFNQFNLLWHEKRVWVIDVSQSVEPIHPMGLEFLLRDCVNLHKFFASRLEKVYSPEELFMKITGVKFDGEGQVFLSQLQKYTKDKQLELKAASKEEPDKPFNFDYHFERTQDKSQTNTQ